MSNEKDLSTEVKTVLHGDILEGDNRYFKTEWFRKSKVISESGFVSGMAGHPVFIIIGDPLGE
jgi:hypothetical protein